MIYFINGLYNLSLAAEDMIKIMPSKKNIVKSSNEIEKIPIIANEIMNKIIIAQKWCAFGIANIERTTGKIFDSAKIAKQAISEQGRKNRKDKTSKKKNALIKGLLLVCKKIGHVPTELELRQWLKDQEDESFLTNLTVCPEIWLSDNNGKEFIGFSFREKEDQISARKESKIAFGTYKNEYIAILRQRLQS